MRILIGTYEICGWVSLFQKEFIKLGHQCDTLVKSKNRFYSSTYTYDSSRYQIKIRPGNWLIAAVNNLVSSLYLRRCLRRKYDVVVYIWDTILPAHEDVKKFSEAGTKIIFLFTGSDVRTYSLFSKSYDVSQWQFPDYWIKENTDKKRQYVETAEKFADLIYSVPDQSGLQKRSYYHLQIPIDLSQFVFRNNQRQVPNVVHLPSDPWKKGTDVIEKAIRELIAEGVKINFFSYRNIKHDQMPEILQDMDILVDEIVFHGPGVLSFEAMASGCAVATRYIEASPAVFCPPVWNINANNIKSRLAELFRNYELQQQLIDEGRKYVEEYNRAAKVAGDILEKLAHPTPPDYIL